MERRAYKMSQIKGERHSIAPRKSRTFYHPRKGAFTDATAWVTDEVHF